MNTLYMIDPGQQRFEVFRVLTVEYDVSLADAKMMLAGVRTKILDGELLCLYEVQERLTAMGVRTVIVTDIEYQLDYAIDPSEGTMSFSYESRGVVEECVTRFDADGNVVEEITFKKIDDEPPDEPRILREK